MTADSRTLYFEDLQPGQCFCAGPLQLTPEELERFARLYDPQPFHLDPTAASSSVFGRQVASGWQTAAMAMRLLTQSALNRICNGLVGLQIDRMRWPKPVCAGDTLRAEFAVLACRRSQSQPGFGIVTLAWRCYNQYEELVLQLENQIWVAARAEQDAAV